MPVAGVENPPRLTPVTALGAVHTNGHKPHPAPDSEFWAERDYLTHIHQAALARRVSPWAVLGVALTRVIAAVPPFVTLPAIIAGPGSLNLFIALVGPPASGKGGATTTATETVLTAGSGQQYATHSLGSGQGIAHSYGKREKDGTFTRHSVSALFVAEEIDSMGATIRQTGSTLLPELRSLWMGEPLGKMYVDPAKRIEIPAHTYRACLIAHVQPNRAGTLLDDADGGTPQRFMWMPATYPHSPLRPEGPTAPLRWRSPVWRAVGGPDTGVTLPVCALAWQEIDASHLAASRGEGDPLDGHRLFCQLKVAAALGIIDGRPEVTEADWQLARLVMARSDQTRSEVLDSLKSAKAKAYQDRAAGAAISAVAVDDALTESAELRVCRTLRRTIPMAPEWISRREMVRRVAGRDRPHVDGALVRLQAAGQLIYDRTARGVKYQRPEER
jgi:hypothetical protein